jgi:putative endonuclease
MNSEMVEETKHYCVYILSCADGSLYTGMTADLPRRLAEHRAGRGSQWTQRRRPVELAFSLADLDYRSAREVERYVKSLSRARKQALVNREPGMLALVRRRV